jgi:hypothetical protein
MARGWDVQHTPGLAWTPPSAGASPARAAAARLSSSHWSACPGPRPRIAAAWHGRRRSMREGAAACLIGSSGLGLPRSIGGLAVAQCCDWLWTRADLAAAAADWKTADLSGPQCWALCSGLQAAARSPALIGGWAVWVWARTRARGQRRGGCPAGSHEAHAMRPQDVPRECRLASPRPIAQHM